MTNLLKRAISHMRGKAEQESGGRDVLSRIPCFCQFISRSAHIRRDLGLHDRQPYGFCDKKPFFDWWV